jgi:5-methylcytosine-specific restriction endonuclease McrA
MPLSRSLRSQVRLRATGLCEYCHSPEAISSARFEIDHVQPRSLGGSDEFNNLALACQRCNANRYNFTQAIDPITQTQVNLFHPRNQTWSFNGQVMLLKSRVRHQLDEQRFHDWI